MLLFFLSVIGFVTSQRSHSNQDPTGAPPPPPGDRCLKFANIIECYKKKKIPLCTDNFACPTPDHICPECIPYHIFRSFPCNRPPSKKCSPRGLSYPIINEMEGTICPPCFEDWNPCTREELRTCQQKIVNSQIPRCLPDENPDRTRCCISCISTPNDQCAIPTKECSSTDEIHTRDDKGCRICEPKTPTRPEGGECSKSSFQEYKEKVPECAQNEKPLVDKSRLTCGPTCVRPASKKHLLEVVYCKKEMPECEDDDSSKRDFFLADRACPICEPKKPTCPRECTERQVCIRHMTKDKKSKIEKKCVNKRRIVLRMNMKQDIITQFANFTKADMEGTLKELLQRYCERISQVDRCGKNLERILDSLKCVALKKVNTNKTFEVDVEVAESEIEDEDTTQLLEDAVKDDDTALIGAESTPPSKIPLEKMCFVPENIAKCRLLGVKMSFCENERPKCERKIVENAKKNRFLMICPSCIPGEYVDHLCKEKDLMPCMNDKIKAREEVWNSAKKSICPSCIQVEEDNQCSWDAKKMCVAKLKNGQIPSCEEGEVAVMKDCCVSCQLAVKPMEDECDISELSVCGDPTDDKSDKREAGEKTGERDAKGCRKCAPRGPIRKIRNKCSSEDFRSYKALVPSCASGERVFVNSNSTRCGPPCVRPASKKNLLQVMACVKDQRECEDDSDDDSNRRTFLPNAACSICVPKKPSCGCEENQVCIRVKKVKKCVDKKRFVMSLNVANSIASKTHDLDKEAFTRVLIEFVERFCERNSQVERCSRFLSVFRDSLKCVAKTKKDDVTVEVEVEVAAAETATTRRLLAEDSAAEFLVEASLDDDTYVASAQVITSDMAPPPTPPTKTESGSTIRSISTFLITLPLFFPILI